MEPSSKCLSTARARPKGTPDDNRAAQAIGVSRGGLTTKIVAMVDKGGQLAGFVLTSGNSHEPHSRPGLWDGAPTHELIADKAYDTNATLRREIAVVIPSRGNRKAPRRCDPVRHGMRHFGGEPVCGAEGVSGLAARYCQRALMYGGCSTWRRLWWPCARRCRGIRPAVNRRLAM